MAFKLSNVIGAPFQLYITQQLATRSVRGATGKTAASPLRTADEVLFLANKTAWVKLQSSVDISGSVVTGSVTDTRDYYNLLKEQDDFDPAWWPEDGDWESTNSALAQKWILQSGTSYKAPGTGDLTLRTGLDYNGAYGLGGIKAQGYRPMPGLESVTIETKGKLGSLRYATIDFKVWNMHQLDVIDALYFRLGFTMLLEWGHTQYFVDKDSSHITNASGIDVPFYNSNVTKEGINQAINEKIFDTRGNYDGMLGIVTNFNYSMNQEGGWDCSIKLIGLGSLLDTQRITSNYKLPKGVAEYYDKIAADFIEKQRQAIFEQKQKNYQKSIEETDTKNKKTIDDFNIKNPIRRIGNANRGENNSISERSEFAGTEQDRLIQHIKFFPDTSKDNGIVLSGDDVDGEKPLLTMLKQMALFKDDGNLQGEPFEADFYYKDMLYLPRLGEKGILNPLTFNGPKGTSTITIDMTALGVVAGKLLSAGDLLTNGRVYDTDPLANVLVPSQGYSNGATILLASSLQYSKNSLSQKIGDRVDLSQKEVYDFKQANSVTTVSATTITGYEKVTKYVLGIGISSIKGSPGNSGVSDFYFQLDASNNYKATERQRFDDLLLNAVDQAFSGNPQFKLIRSLKDETKNTIRYVAESIDEFIIPGAFTLYDDSGKSKIVSNLAVKLLLTTNITSFITDIVDSGVTPLNLLPYGVPPVKDTGEFTEAELASIKKASGLESALEAMLRIVQMETINQFIKSNIPRLWPIDHSTGVMLTATPTTLFSSIFKLSGSRYVIDKSAITTALTTNTEKTNPLSIGLKGFNTSLMSGQSVGSSMLTQATKYSSLYKEAYDQCYPANPDEAVKMFTGLCQSYYIPYTITNTAESSLEQTLSRPVYIKLGYLLFFINNYCLLYDTSKDKKARPFFYIDFNPETNLCFTIPQQLSVDPFTCLIPYKGDNYDYKEIFTSISGSVDTVFNGAVTKTEDRKLFVKSDDKVSGIIAGYETGVPVTGKSMHILLNVEHLLNLLRSATQADGHGGVYLKPFLDGVVTDINKALGDINSFRVAYQDQSNTVIIADDQFVAPTTREDNIVAGENLVQAQLTAEYASLISRNGTIVMPVYGPGSLVRSFQFETNITTKMSSVIAIGATSGQAAAQGIDGTGFRALSRGLIDRVMPLRTEVDPEPATVLAASNLKTKDDNNESVPIKFNQHVKRVYGGGKLDTDDIRMAENYLIINSANVKAGNSYTNANPVIPLNCSFTMDGIGGIMMGNCFLLPNEIMPISVRGNGALTKFGFIVNKLDHSIQGNEWLTTVGGQMIRLKDVAAPNKAPSIAKPVTGANYSNNQSTFTGKAANLTSATSQLKILYDEFKAVGLNQAAAAGAAGVMFGESGLTYNAWIIGATKKSGKTTTKASSVLGQTLDPQSGPTFVRPTYQGRRITAYGIPQWVDSRLDNYVVFANANGGDSYETQVKFVIKELKTTRAYGKLKTVANTSDGAVQAASDWLDYYEFSAPFITDETLRNPRYANAVGAFDIIKNY